MFLGCLPVFASDCPKGLVDDPYPGACGLYIDADGNGICDYSEEEAISTKSEEATVSVSEKEMKAMTVAEFANSTGIDPSALARELSSRTGTVVNKDMEMGYLHDKYGLCMNSVKAMIGEIETQETAVPLQEQGKRGKEPSYLLEISIVMTLLYILSLAMVKKEVLSAVTNKKIWNVVLLISFLVVLVTSLAMLLRTDYGLSMSNTINYSYWHIEAGIVMMLVSVFHTLWHADYYIKLLKNKGR